MKDKAPRTPIATWWQISRYAAEIKPVKVVAVTAHFVTFLEKVWRLEGPDSFRETRSARDDFFPTFEEAKDELIRRANRKVEAAKDELQRRRSYLGKVQSLQKPEAA